MSKKTVTNETDGEKRLLLKRVPIFQKLKEEELEPVVTYSSFRDYADDEVIFQQGSNGESLYVVKRGRVRIVSRTNGESRDIAQFIEGELFGELDLFEDAPRTVDAVAETETSLLVFPREGLDFQELLKKHPALFARILNKLLAQVAVRIRETNRLVSEKTPWIEDLRKQLLYDKLTGLYNKTYLSDELETELGHWGEATTLLAVKPDNFKLINDGYGHEAGDKALRLLADTVKARAGGEGIVVRYRGDEFVLILPKMNAQAARGVAEGILSAIPAIDLAPVVNTGEISLTVSIGLASWPLHGEHASQVVEKAVERMFVARKEGGNRIDTD